MKKLTLNQTWVLCLRMWRWIAKEWKKLEEDPHDIHYWVVLQKAKWLRDHGYASIKNNCFFCERVDDRVHVIDCVDCPGALVDSEFHCYDAGWCFDPPRFLSELLRLNRIRKGKK